MYVLLAYLRKDSLSPESWFG